MTYRAIGMMSGSSLDGLDIVFAEFTVQGDQWQYRILAADCIPYPEEWVRRLRDAIHLGARDYLLLHAAYGHFTGEQVNAFIQRHGLEFQVALVSSHGHTTFHVPEGRMTAQLGDGAAIAAVTGLPVVSDLRALDVALGGQGAPIVPMGERQLLGDYRFFLNLGGIANLSEKCEPYIAFDVCPANRVLNLLASTQGLAYDDQGRLAASGTLNHGLLEDLNQQAYYDQTYPKSLANDFGTDILYPMIRETGIPTADALRTFTEHIAVQVGRAVRERVALRTSAAADRMLVTGGGGFNTYLMDRIADHLGPAGVLTEVPEPNLVNYKEALIMAFLGVLRWRQEYTVLSSVTGARHDSIGGALWNGQEA
ncbi:MAG: hypothetical protein RJA57_1282 [Bacteroidota bacterium]